MERYITQLIEDIHKARTHVKAPSEEWDSVNLEDEGEIEDMAFAEKYIYGKSEPLYKITGIATEMFPPPEKLSTLQQEKLALEMEALLLHHNFMADFPVALPQNQKYAFLRNIWDQEQVEVSFGTVHIEFCDFETDNCPFPGYCTTCEEIKAQMKEDEKNSGAPDLNIDDLLPF